MLNRHCVQKETRESERLYDLVVLTDQLLCMGLTFSVLQPDQPCTFESKETRGQPSDHIQQTC